MPDSNDTPNTDHAIRSAIADATRPTALVGQLPPAFDDTATAPMGRRGRQDLVGRAPGSPETSSATETVHLHRGEVWGGDFELGPLIGRGGMGAVYAGRQRSLERPVAIKALRGHLSDDPELVARFEQEAKWLARISSPHVIQVHAFGQHKNHHFLVMELVEGEDLGKKLKSGWRPSPAEAVELIAQAARGLIVAGEHGIVHRDIKPGNMMLTTRGTLKLTDFGLARLVHGPSNLSSTGVILGTDAYMSPEQCQGRAVDQRSDIYSLGVVFYELLTGRRPFTGETHMEVFCQHLERDPTPPTHHVATIPREVEAVVLQMLAKDPQHRYPSATELLADLERILAKQQPLARPRRRGIGRLLIAVTALVVGAVAAWWLWLRTPAETVASHAPPPPVAPTHQPVAVVPTPAPAPQAPREAPPTPKSDTSLAPVAMADVERLAKLKQSFAALSARAATPEPARRMRLAWAEFLDQARDCAAASDQCGEADRAWRALSWTDEVEAPHWATAFTRDDYGPLTEVIKDGYVQRFRWCPPGDYIRGSPDEPTWHRPDEREQRVTLSHGFWIAETEVTRPQWRAVMEDGDQTPLPVPVVEVSWAEASDFCARLGRKGIPATLPSEAEWEYACRAGCEPAPTELPTYGWTGTSPATVQAVKQQKKPNAWGIFDLHGNAAEWCADWYAPYPDGDARDPHGPDQGSERVYRGGATGWGERDCRAAARFHARPSDRLDTLGFRVIVRE